MDEAGGLIKSGVAVGGMIPKLETAMGAVQKGVGSAVVMDGCAETCAEACAEACAGKAQVAQEAPWMRAMFMCQDHFVRVPRTAQPACHSAGTPLARRVPHCTLVHLFGENPVGTTITNEQ